MQRARKWFYHCKNEYLTLMSAVDEFCFTSNSRGMRKSCIQRYESYLKTKATYEGFINILGKIPGVSKRLVKEP